MTIKELKETIANISDSAEVFIVDSGIKFVEPILKEYSKNKYYFVKV